MSLLLLMPALTVIVEGQLRIGVSLLPYYSWTRNIVGDKAEVIPLLPHEVDPHNYQPGSKAIQQLSVDILFTEMDYAVGDVHIIKEETGVYLA